jgi:hypothetical protein
VCTATLEATIDEYHGHVSAIREQLSREAGAHEAALRERDAKLSAYESALSVLGGSLHAGGRQASTPAASPKRATGGSPGHESPRHVVRSPRRAAAGRGAGSSNRTSASAGHAQRTPAVVMKDEELIAQLARVADVVERQRTQRN